MIPYERKLKILDVVKETNFISIIDLVKLFPDFSESTIRRDLKSLADNNNIELLHGGGIKFNGNSTEVPIEKKINLNKAEKQYIGELAASLVQDNETIYIDSGTTPLAIIPFIKANNVTIVTTNTAIFNQEINPKISQTIIVGGKINYSIASVSGTLTDESLAHMYFNRAFIGATGFGIETGITTPDMKEVTKKRIVSKNSTQTYVVADSLKLNKKAIYSAFSLDQCTIITNSNILSFNENGIEYYY